MPLHFSVFSGETFLQQMMQDEMDGNGLRTGVVTFRTETTNEKSSGQERVIREIYQEGIWYKKGNSNKPLSSKKIAGSRPER